MKIVITKGEIDRILYHLGAEKSHHTGMCAIIITITTTITTTASTITISRTFSMAFHGVTWSLNRLCLQA